MTRWRGRDPDATYVLRPKRRSRTWSVLGAAALVVLGLAAWLWHAPAPQAAMKQADEAAILAAPVDTLTVWRYAPAPAILVLVFPTLHAQALTFNRVAAFIEKAGAPHDRVLDDAGLDAAIRAGHGSFDLYYGGHDYRAADLFRFLATAADEHVRLRPEERAVGDLLRETRAAALITLPPPGAGIFDPTGRAAILRHELSHGAYFSDPGYAAYVARFWAGLQPEARAAFRAYLGARGYDTGNEDLMRNEMQAYLAFTPDPRLCRPESFAIGAAAIRALRARFVAGMPHFWLRDLAEK